MKINRSNLFKPLRLFDAGAAVLFFGALAQQTDLQQSANTALTELAAHGYKIPSENDPVKVFPALTDGEFSARHAGGWRPGSIYLRNRPQGGFGADIYLRHELFHEVSYRTCAGRLPIWAEEAAAMQFSGELNGQEVSVWPNEDELQVLKQHIRQGAELSTNDRALLFHLLVKSDRPAEPCAVSAKLKQLLAADNEQTGSSAYLLMSLLSGRVLESSGDQLSRMPPGSLLKIPYAAALSQANPEVLAAELAASDTDKLLARREQFQPERYRLLLSTIKDQHLTEQTKPQILQDWRAYLGERQTNGQFPLQANLPELALAMRAALLSQPAYFKGLSKNGLTPGSTLAAQNSADKNRITQMQAMVKTGSVSTANGRSLVGHLLVVWPASHPVYLAIFRQQGVRGASILPKAAGYLKNWQHDYPPEYAGARVKLLTPTLRSSWEANPECPELKGPQYRFTTCGTYHIVSTATASRSERLVDGILHEASDNGPTILETDSESYADAVMSAEAQTLTGNARQAMRAVIAWNAAHGQHRHQDSDSLCDTTHCMVFLGKLPDEKPATGGKIDIDLLHLLDKLANDSALNWLPFANGGDQRWQKQIPGLQLRNQFAESRIEDIRRERRKSGDLFIHLYYADSEESIPCEIFRNTLKLPSCPDEIKAISNQDAWQFQGIGAGHGLGLSILQAQALSEHGRSAEQILRDAYGKLPDH